MLKGITVGCGFFGHIHLEGWNRVQNARIVAVVDKDEAQAQMAADQLGVPNYTDVEDAIWKEEPDFVDIATQPRSHLQIAQAAASKDCHVLCQKPIAPTWEESVELVEICRKYGVRLMINENWRWQPWYREIKGLVESGAIGHVTTITLTRHDAHALCTSPFSNQTYFVDVERFLLIESVIHLIDLTKFLSGKVREIFCDIRRVSGVTRGEDNVFLHLRLEDDVWGIIYSTRCSEPDVEDPICDCARIEGKNGFIRLDGDGTITVKPLFKPTFKHEYEIPKVGYKGDSVRLALQHFVDCLLTGEPFETEGEDYLRQVMRAIFAGYQSVETREAVSL